MSDHRQKQAKQRNPKDIIQTLVVILILLVAVIVLLLLKSCQGPGNGPPVVLPPDYTDLQPDGGAEIIPGDNSAPTPMPSGSGSVTLNFTGNAQYSLSSRTLSLCYQNPKASTHNVVVQVVLTSGESEYLLAQSGIVAPGYQITSLEASDQAPQLSQGGYAGKLKLLFYDPTTGQQAMVDTSIPCTVVVNN